MQISTTQDQCVDTQQGGRDLLSPALIGSRRCGSLEPIVYENLGGSAEIFRKHLSYDKDRPAIIAWVSRQGAVVVQATRDFTVKTVQKAANLAVQAGSRLYTDSASSYRALTGYVHEFVNHTRKE
jgi:ISXO2-like transposase domain